jgi:hypothetical protein
VLLIVISIIVVLLSVLVIGFWISNRPSPNPQQSETQKQLTIASFTSEIKSDDPRILAYLDLEIHNYWTEGNNVKCAGRVRWRTHEYTLEGLNVCMFITKNYTQPNSVNVKVVAYGGLLLLPSGTIDSDSVSVPKLGEQLFSFDFLLTCTYHP